MSMNRDKTKGYVYLVIIPSENIMGFNGYLSIATDGTFSAFNDFCQGNGRSITEAVANMTPIKEKGWGFDFERDYYNALRGIKQRSNLSKSVMFDDLPEITKTEKRDERPILPLPESISRFYKAQAGTQARPTRYY